MDLQDKGNGGKNLENGRNFRADVKDGLADGGVLKQIPVADYAELLVEGELGDVGRPTVYDFLAHTALEFYAMEETAASKPADAFEVP